MTSHSASGYFIFRSYSVSAWSFTVWNIKIQKPSNKSPKKARITLPSSPVISQNISQNISLYFPQTIERFTSNANSCVATFIRLRRHAVSRLAMLPGRATTSSTGCCTFSKSRHACWSFRVTGPAGKIARDIPTQIVFRMENASWISTLAIVQLTPKRTPKASQVQHLSTGQKCWFAEAESNSLRAASSRSSPNPRQDQSKIFLQKKFKIVEMPNYSSIFPKSLRTHQGLGLRRIDDMPLRNPVKQPGALAKFPEIFLLRSFPESRIIRTCNSHTHTERTYI